MTEEFQKHIRSQKLFPAGAKVLLAVSGGMDSVALCELFHRSGFPFALAHCNFNLRGKESDGDEIFVKKLAARYKTDFFCTRFDTKNFASAKKLSIQEAARNLRYTWFEKVRKENHFQFIATAHHANDSIETFFINLLRGTGLDGLKGIPVKNGKIIRPLLFATRREIETYARDHKLQWRNDSSNKSDDYLRNRVRKELIPVLTRLQHSLEKTMLQDMLHITEALTCLEDWFSERLKSASTPLVNGGLKIDLGELKGKWMPLVLYHVLKDKGFNRSQASAIAGVTTKREAGRVFYANEYEALKDRNLLIIRKRRIISDLSKTIGLQTTSFRLGPETWKIHRRGSLSFNLSRDSATASLDAGKLCFPLTVRHWKEGDFFYPLGLKGKKKVSDFLVDKKISLFGKENIFVILSGSDIACILGYRIDERYKVTPETMKVLVIEPLKKQEAAAGGRKRKQAIGKEKKKQVKKPEVRS